MKISSPCNPPAPTGCARHDAVGLMMHHLETTCAWETGWDDRSEDSYYNGEMLSYRRTVFPGNNSVTFIFCEDKTQSYGYIMAEGKSCTVTEKSEYDDVMAALKRGAGCFTALMDSKKTAEH
jgi:hypothetical protein